MEGRRLMVVFSSCLKLSLLELFMSILSSMSHSFSHPFIMPSFCSFSFVDLGIVLDLLLYLLFLLCKGLVDNTYPKEYTNDSKQGQCCHRAKGHLLCYRKVSFNILICIESLSHVSNNVPQLFQKLLLARIYFTLHLKSDFHV